MPKILLLTTLFVVSAFAGSIEFAKKMNYELNYKTALKKAKTQNKPMMLVIGTKTCPWCRKLERQTLKKDLVNNMVKQNFIPVSLTRDIDDFPKAFYPKAVPTVYFIDPNAQKSIHISMGYKNKNDFKNEILKALKKK